MINGTLAQLPPLVALKAISNGALAADKLPARLKVLNWGHNESTKGNVLLDSTSAAALAANQRRHGFERVALDFEHNTVPGSAEYERSQEPRRVAAYGTPALVPNDGLYLENLEWTPAGNAEAKNFADLSPAPGLDADGRVIFLHSVALVRNGAVHDLTFFSATGPNQNQNDMDATQLNAALKPLTDSIAALAADLKAHKEAPVIAPVISFKAGDKDITLTLAEAGAKLVKFEADMAAHVAGIEKKSKADVIARFAAEGKAPLGADKKALTVEQLSALPLDQLTILLANTPITVPLAARQKQPTESGNTGDFGSAVITLSAEKKITKSAAMDLVIAEQPELYSAWREQGAPRF